MPYVFGGLFLENLLSEDRHFALQWQLFEKGLIQGVQLRVAHPCFIPDLSGEQLREILLKLPGREVFIHCGAENVGVDFGQNFDECGVFSRHSSIYTWKNWNLETLRWSLRVAKVAQAAGYNTKGISVHPGYGKTFDEGEAYLKIISALMGFSGHNILLENVPPIVRKNFYQRGETKHWRRDEYWGVGGTPADMNDLLSALGSPWRCLIDFTHLVVMVNQAKKGFLSIPDSYKDIGKAIDGYLNLPHSLVCHFSGVPNTLIDSHDFIDVFSALIKEALQQMEIICLEIPFKPGEPEVTQQTIEKFCQQYLG